MTPGPDVKPGTIPCLPVTRCPLIGRYGCRHSLYSEFGPMSRMREDPVFQRIVGEMVEHYGMKMLHIPDSRLVSLRGWPDCTIIGGRKILHRELKAYHSRLEDPQRECGELIMASGGDWGVWRTRDLYSGGIERALLEIGVPR